MARRKKRKATRFTSTSAPTPAISLASLPTMESKYALTITLKSDLCSCSGDGFSSGIDSDICYDAEGIPTIPGRRIKGCLREAALETHDADSLFELAFGKTGSGDAGLITVSNAGLVHAETFGDQQTTLDRYTYTRAQTKVDPKTGTAQENTLRFVRVVRHYRDDGSEARFEAPIVVDTTGLDDDTRRQIEDLVSDAALALRNMGLGRNRGFGAVRCQLGPSKNPSTTSLGYLKACKSDNDSIVLSYRVHLDAPLMLPQKSGTRSAAHIPGASVFGFLARKLKSYDAFDELFFGENLYCSPLYPVDAEGNRCLPAAPFVVKVKGGAYDGRFINARDYERRANNSPDDWGTPKPLRDGFLSPITWNPVKVDTQTLYHHSTVGDGTLYTQTCISAGQDFAGYVECAESYAGVVAAALTSGTLSFGRSKSAQYATCSLVKNQRDHIRPGETMPISKNHMYALLLESDTLVLGEDATYATDHATLENALRQALANVCGDSQPLAKSDADSGKDHPISNIQTTLITGYNAKWNQKRPHIRAYSAGSCIVFEAQAACAKVPVTFRIGERQAEGFGQIRLIDLTKVQPENQARTSSEATSEPTNPTESLRRKTITFAESHRSELCASPFVSSFVGRIALMVRESSSEQEFKNRLASIKDDKKREAVQRLFDGLKKHLPPKESRQSQSLSWTELRECLDMLFRLAKYYLKQKSGEEATNAK